VGGDFSGPPISSSPIYNQLSTNMRYELTGKTVLVTGGSAGLVILPLMKDANLL